MAQDLAIRHNSDGSIDFAFHRARAQRHRRAVKRKLWRSSRHQALRLLRELADRLWPDRNPKADARARAAMQLATARARDDCN